MKRFAVLILFTLGAAGSAGAYVRITTSNGQQPRWLFSPVSFWINEAGSPQISNGSEFTAVRAACQAWQNVESTNMRLDYKGTTSVRTIGRDSMNLVSFSDDTTPLGANTLAATFSFFGSANGQLFISEADILLN